MALTRPKASQINTVITNVSDPIIVLNNNSTVANIDIGLVLNRGSAANVAMVWQESSGQFVLATTTSSGLTNANVTISSYANLRVGNINVGTITLTNGAVIKDTVGDAIAFGQDAGNISQGIRAIAIGQNAGRKQGESSIAVGYNSGNNQSIFSTAVGYAAAYTNQSADAVALGSEAGHSNQGLAAVAVGRNAGDTNQGENSIAVGYWAAVYDQGSYAVAIGSTAGQNYQGTNSIALGYRAGYNYQAANTIILNASGVATNGVAAQTDSFYVNPIRNATGNVGILQYNSTTNEVTYNTNVTITSATITNLIGDANVTVTGSLLPSANVTYDLGSPTQRWRSGWFAGSTIHIGSESISVDTNGKWMFTSDGATVELGKNNDFNPPSANVSGAVTAGSINVTGHLSQGTGTYVARQYVLHGTTTNATETEILTVGDGARMPVNTNTTVMYDIHIVARRTDATGESAAWQLQGCADNFSNSVADVGDIYEVVVAQDDVTWAVDARADDTNNSINLYVTGAANKTIRWTAVVKTIEVAQ